MILHLECPDAGQPHTPVPWSLRWAHVAPSPHGFPHPCPPQAPWSGWSPPLALRLHVHPVTQRHVQTVFLVCAACLSCCNFPYQEGSLHPSRCPGGSHHDSFQRILSALLGKCFRNPSLIPPLHSAWPKPPSLFPRRSLNCLASTSALHHFSCTQREPSKMHPMSCLCSERPVASLSPGGKDFWWPLPPALRPLYSSHKAFQFSLSVTIVLLTWGFVLAVPLPGILSPCACVAAPSPCG